MKLTYAITVCNELEEVTRLVDFLLYRIRQTDNILIQYDSVSVTEPVLSYINVMKNLHPNVSITGFPLNNDFATFKNNIAKVATGDFIFQIDADEMPSEHLIDNINDIIETNPEVDIYFLPRVNAVNGITEEHIKRWKWKVNEHGWINFPDLQNRIYRRSDTIQWEGAVHEVLSGYDTFSIFPSEPIYSLLHHKNIERQERQNELYAKIADTYENN
jgi:hypothetical protein